jgi:thiol-disulfide isomerase/thioredoxin
MFERAPMPPLAGAAEWLNSQPLGLTELRGSVVLVNFWTLTCINWLRQEPQVRAWSRAYRDDGLVVIGVHTPEFTFEHDVGLVAQATRQRAIDYPVALDNDYAIWKAFENHYWPALYFVDREGIIRDSQFGEGRYEESERLIQRLLDIERDPAPIEAEGAEAPADWDHLGTPETYLGYGRGERFASRRELVADRSRVYELPESLGSNEWALAGEWTIEREKLVLGKAGGSLSCRFEARDAHLVLSNPAAHPIAFRVLLDGAAPGSSHGVDVDEEGNGSLREGRLYQLLRADGAIRERTFEITFLQPGAEAYVLTFG